MDIDFEINPDALLIETTSHPITNNQTEQSTNKTPSSAEGILQGMGQPEMDSIQPLASMPSSPGPSK